MHRWRIGRFSVTEIHELAIDIGLMDDVIPQATPGFLRGLDWMCPDFATDEGQMSWDIHSYVVDTGDSVILVDAGVGNGKATPISPAWTDLDSPYLERMRESGYDRADIDLVLCTHLHVDHVGWLGRRGDEGRWEPTFPHAEVLLVRAEYDRHRSRLDPPATPMPSGTIRDPASRDLAELADAWAVHEQTKLIHVESLQPVIDAGLLRIVEPDTEAVPGVRYVSTPGHTPGHQSVRLDSEGAAAFLTGDFFHHPVQIARPDWSSQGDWHGETTARHRLEFLEATAGSALLVLGHHFTGPGGGYIVREGEGFKLVTTGPG